MRYRKKPGGLQMLILTRRLGEGVVIVNDIVVTVSDIKNGQIKLGISASKDVTVNREEVVREINEENVLSSASGVINHIKE
jgi:carbon storage regulator